MASFWKAVGLPKAFLMWSRTGTFFHGFRLGGSRISPALMSISPGVATPMAAMSFSLSFAAATAWRMRLAHRFEAGVLAEFGASVEDDGLGERLAGVVHDRGLHRGAADVQTDEVPLRRHEPTPRPRMSPMSSCCTDQTIRAISGCACVNLC